MFAPPLALCLSWLVLSQSDGSSCCLACRSRSEILVSFNFVPLASIFDPTVRHKLGLCVCKMHMISTKDTVISQRRVSVLQTLSGMQCSSQMKWVVKIVRHTIEWLQPSLPFSPCSDGDCLHICRDASRRSRAYYNWKTSDEGRRLRACEPRSITTCFWWSDMGRVSSLFQQFWCGFHWFFIFS